MHGVPSASRGLYLPSQLNPLLQPRSIAVVGASARMASFGYRTLANLAESSATVYAVNPNRTPINGRPSYATVGDLPDVPDCAVIAVPRDAVESAVLDCARAGIKGVLVYASGYAETGRHEHQALQQRLVRIGQEFDMRILGPNCIGVMSAQAGLRISFADVPKLDASAFGSIGLVSQSGGLGLALAQSSAHGYSFSHVLTSGNACDVDIADQIAFLVDQPECKAIACLFEGMADPMRLMAAGELAWKAGKPVIIHKLAVGQEGMEAAKSHTGSMAGSAEVYRAAFERAGFVEVSDFEALVETAAFFAKAGRPSSEGVAALATSGGASIMVADKAEEHGVLLPQPNADVAALLRSHIPEFGSARNPCDVTAEILNNPEAMPACASALLSCDEFSALVIPHPYAYAPGTTRLQALAEVGRECGKPVCCVWLSQWLDGPGAQIVEQDEHLMLFRSMSRCLVTLRAWFARERHMKLREAGSVRSSDFAAAAEAAPMLEDGVVNGIITEGQAKRVLQAYGVPVVPELSVQDADAAARAAASVGFPVVLKVESPDVPHKTEAGGVALHLRNEAEVREAFARVSESVRRHVPGARISGFLIQPMVQRDIELIVGARRDPQFGPVVVVGLGGVLVELLQDSVVALAPVSESAAHAMLDRLRGRALLDGFRGSAPADRNALAQAICRISELVVDHADTIAELDVNPLVVSQGRIVAVDALIAVDAVRQAAPSESRHTALEHVG